MASAIPPTSGISFQWELAFLIIASPCGGLPLVVSPARTSPASGSERRSGLPPAPCRSAAHRPSMVRPRASTATKAAVVRASTSGQACKSRSRRLAPCRCASGWLCSPRDRSTPARGRRNPMSRRVDSTPSSCATSRPRTWVQPDRPRRSLTLSSRARRRCCNRAPAGRKYTGASPVRFPAPRTPLAGRLVAFLDAAPALPAPPHRWKAGRRPGPLCSRAHVAKRWSGSDRHRRPRVHPSRWLAVPSGLAGADGRGAWRELRVVGRQSWVRMRTQRLAPTPAWARRSTPNPSSAK